MPEHQNAHPQIFLDPHEADARILALFDQQTVEALMAKLMQTVRSLERKSNKPA